MYVSGLFLCLVSLAASKPWTEQDKDEVGRIVNGQEAAKGELPYQASIQLSSADRQFSEKGSHFCGAAIFEDNWAITAAHCMKYAKKNSLLVVAGTNDITDRSSPTYRVKKIVKNKYNDITKKNDLSLLKLEPVPSTEDRRKDHKIKNVPLCRKSFEPQGKNCTVSGWGHLKSKGSSVPNKLREVSVLVLHGETCAKMLSGYPWDNKENTMLCAGGEDKDACQGDSGGPLVCQTETGDRCLAGVVSWGVGCATEGVPGVYTNVRNYLDWIEENIK